MWIFVEQVRCRSYAVKRFILNEQRHFFRLCELYSGCHEEQKLHITIFKYHILNSLLSTVIGCTHLLELPGRLFFVASQSDAPGEALAPPTAELEIPYVLR